MRSLLHSLGGRDPYEILGVSRDATTAEVVAAHRRLVRRLHPDAPTGDEDTAVLLNLARDVLRDRATRAEYDRLAAQKPAAGRGPGGDRGYAESGAADARGRSERASPPWPPPRPPTGPPTPPVDPIPDGHRPGASPPWSAWDGPGIHQGAARSPYTVPPAGPIVAPGWPGTYYPAPGWAAARQPDPIALGVTALVLSLSCAPIGLILGVIGLVRYRTGSSGRLLSIIATTIGAVSVVLSILMWAILAWAASVG